MYRGQGVQLDVVAAAPREKKLLIGKAKWGRDALSRNVLTDLLKRSQWMPQVAEGWQTQYALFARGRFTDALAQEVQESGSRLISLSQMEQLLAEVR
jgi:hypothetical protein